MDAKVIAFAGLLRTLATSLLRVADHVEAMHPHKVTVETMRWYTHQVVNTIEEGVARLRKVVDCE